MSSFRISKSQGIPVVTVPTYSYPPSYSTQVLFNGNYWSYPQSYIKPSNFTPANSFDISAISSDFALTASLKYAGSVLNSKGLIYSIPSAATNVYILNTYTNRIDLSSISNLTFSNYPVIGNVSAEDKWTGGVLFNDNMYAIPQASKAILKVNTNTNQFSFIDISNLATVSYNWVGGVLAPDSRIYGIPHNINKVLRINTANDTAINIDISGGTPGASPYYYGGVLAPNGRIYGIPFGATAVLVIDPVAGTSQTDIAGLTGLPAGNKWAGGVLAPNGNIYCVPYDSNNVLVINTNTNTTSTFSVTGLTGSNKYAGGVLGLDGKIYCSPNSATSVLVIDPVTNTGTITSISNLPSGGLYKWAAGGVLAPNGKIYLTPGTSTRIGVIKTSLPTQEPWMLAPEFNKL